MTDAMMESRHHVEEFQTCGLREAFASYARRRFPVRTQALVEKEWDLTADEAKGLVHGHTSIRTIERVLHHRRGSWPVAVAVLASVIGASVVSYFASEKAKLNHEVEQRRRRAAALEEAERFLQSEPSGLDADPPDHGSGVAGRASGGRTLLAP